MALINRIAGWCTNQQSRRGLEWGHGMQGNLLADVACSWGKRVLPNPQVLGPPLLGKCSWLSDVTPCGAFSPVAVLGSQRWWVHQPRGRMEGPSQNPTTLTSRSSQTRFGSAP